MGDVRMYNGKAVELLSITHIRAGEQYCTILMENRLGRKQRQSVLLCRLTPVPADTAEARGVRLSGVTADGDVLPPCC